MGFFNKIKKEKSKDEKAEKTIERISIFDTDYPIDKSNWFQVFSACLGQVIAIQEACAEQVVKNQNWNVDFRLGTLTFGKDVYPMQFIGSEANSNQSWLWAWENINGFDQRILQVAHELKAIGEEWNLEPLMMPRFKLDDTFNGHNLSIVACGILKNHYCYYRGPHDHGAVFMAFSDVPETVFAPVNAEKFASIVIDCIQNYHIDHQIFVESFLMWNNTKYDWQDQQIVAHFSTDIIIVFEQIHEFMRISSIKNIKPEIS